MEIYQTLSKEVIHSKYEAKKTKSDNFTGSNKEKSNILLQLWKNAQFGRTKIFLNFGCTNIIAVFTVYSILIKNVIGDPKMRNN